MTAFDRVSRNEHAVVGRPAPRFVLADKFGRRYVDVADDASLFSFGATRSLVRPVPQTAPVGTRSFDGVAVHDPVQVSVVAHSRELASREAVVS